MLHVTLLWWGDVTWGYAIAGLGMLLFVRASNRVRVVCGLVLIFVPVVVLRIPELWGWYFLWLLGRFLLGYVAGARRWFEDDGAGHLVVFRRMALWGGVIALANAGYHLLLRFHVLELPDARWMAIILVAVDQLALLGTALSYVGLVVLLLQRSGGRRLLGVLAPAGRMPLTTVVYWRFRPLRVDVRP
jgi:uncharacterized protein